jgi:hypothetical protein
MKTSRFSLIPFLPFLLNHLRLPSPELYPILFLLEYFTSRLLFSIIPSDFLGPFVTPRHEPHGKHPCIVKEAYLLVRYLAMDILLSHARVLRECVKQRCLIIGIHVTIFIQKYPVTSSYPHSLYFFYFPLLHIVLHTWNTHSRVYAALYRSRGLIMPISRL